MTGRIDQMVQGCEAWQLYGSSKSVKPPIKTKSEKGPMERVGVDLFKFGGDTYLVMVDFFSHFPLIKKFGKSSSTAKVIKVMGKWFDLYGYPQHCRHDGEESSEPNLRSICIRWASRVSCPALIMRLVTGVWNKLWAR